MKKYNLLTYPASSGLSSDSTTKATTRISKILWSSSSISLAAKLGRSILVACSLFLVLASSMLPSTAWASGIPVLDASNLAQSTVSALENVEQSIRQVEELMTQLEQYELQLRNSIAPAAYIWDKAERVMNRAMQLQDQLDYYSSKTGDLDSYLNKFGSVDYYRGSENFGVKAKESRELALDTQERTSKQTIRQLDSKLAELREDSEQLSRLQAGSQASVGHMEAIQSGNQLLANQSAQLIDVRAQLLAMQQAQAERELRYVADEASIMAAEEAYFTGQIQRETPVKLKLD